MSRSKFEQAVITCQAKVLNKNANEKGYLEKPQDNLIKPCPHWKEIENDLNEGAGGELKGTRGQKPHFCAVHSSSALCVNNFAPFKEPNTKLSFLGESGFHEVRFEKELPTELQGRWQPNLDCYFENDTTIIGIESKYMEYSKKQAPNRLKLNRETKQWENNLKKYCNREKLSYLPKGFQERIIEHYFKDGIKQHLDVAQLIKHSIGLLNHRRKQKKEKVVLVYLYWEPLDWETLDLTDRHFAKHRRTIEKFKQHRCDIENFKSRMKPFEHFIEFVPLSYPEFWKMYENDALLKDHISKVKKRYGFEIKTL